MEVHSINRADKEFFFGLFWGFFLNQSMERGAVTHDASWVERIITTPNYSLEAWKETSD